LPWDLERIKDLIDPFTGCFVSSIPFTVVYLRLALKAASFFMDSGKEDYQKGLELLKIGTKRLHETIQKINKEPNPLIERYQREKHGWDIYYDILEHIEKGLKEGSAFSLELQKKAKFLVENCRIKFNND